MSDGTHSRGRYCAVTASLAGRHVYTAGLHAAGPGANRELCLASVLWGTDARQLGHRPPLSNISTTARSLITHRRCFIGALEIEQLFLV